MDIVAGPELPAQPVAALLWVDDNEVVNVQAAVVPFGFTDEGYDGGVALVLVGRVRPDGTHAQKPLLALDRDGARILLEELMRHVRLDGAQ